ncbi:hypothetical protein BDA99DRAFT_491895 [Phascolomyces articulosus]|uniref:NodB homology domain-containing protein n=1 Tax=Phascolomyces articulosus TaxID=60185 RepID=A0AAD5KBY2_9FUNG|nr:hypothetical protein BDA99DRAFT_491895 [Phascolomyces articulosus]
MLLSTHMFAAVVVIATNNIMMMTAPTIIRTQMSPRQHPQMISDVKPTFFLLSGNDHPNKNSPPKDPHDTMTIRTSQNRRITNNKKDYPSPWKIPPIDSFQIQHILRHVIDWSRVPKAPIRQYNHKNNTLVTQDYDTKLDPDCWWSATRCTIPKHKDLTFLLKIHQDIEYCPNVGDFGLTFDDGPLTLEGGGAVAEPYFYQFLAKHHQQAGLFFIGSNVLNAPPEALERALSDGHTICVHTWSHVRLTTLTNEEIVAELYWTLRIIKDTMGITPKCWRPPFADVDDRVRAIAHQMGLIYCIQLDYDAQDFRLPGYHSSGEHWRTDQVDALFQEWIEAYQNGTDRHHGHIVVQHELNPNTVAMAEKWLPRLQKVFRVVSWSQCMNVSNPYWEEAFIYPTDDDDDTKRRRMTPL